MRSVQNSSIFLVLLFIAFVSLSCNIFRHISCGLGVCGELGPAPGCKGASHKVKFITFFVSSNVNRLSWTPSGLCGLCMFWLRNYDFSFLTT